MCEFYNVKNMWTIYQFAFILFCCVLHILFSSFSLQSNKSKFHKISIDKKRIFQHEQEPDSNEYIILWRSSSIGKMSLFLLYFVGILQCVIITVNIKIAWVYQNCVYHMIRRCLFRRRPKSYTWNHQKQDPWFISFKAIPQYVLCTLWRRTWRMIYKIQHSRC